MRLRTLLALAAVAVGCLLVLRFWPESEQRLPGTESDPDKQVHGPALEGHGTPPVETIPTIVPPASDAGRAEAKAPKKRVRLTGQIVDALTGDGIGGATIERMQGESTYEGSVPCWRLGDALVPSYSGSGGSVQLDAVQGEANLLRITAEGYAQAMYRIRDPARLSRDGWQLALVPAASLTGIVQDQDGRPIEGAQVFVRPSQAPADARDPGLAFLMVPGHSRFHGRHAARACPSVYWCRTAWTDARGRYTVDDLPAGSLHDIWAEHDGRSTPVAKRVRVSRSAASEHELRFIKLSTLTVQLRYQDGAPVGSGRIILMDASSHRRVADARLGSDGVVVFHHLHPGELLIRGNAGGPLRERVVMRAGEDETRTLTADAEEAPPPDSETQDTPVTHTLVDAKGRPVSGAKIEVNYGRSEATVRSDERGRFSYTRRRHRVPELVIRADGFHVLKLERWRVKGLSERVSLQRLIPLTITATFPPDRPPAPRFGVILRDESGMGYSRDLAWKQTGPGTATLHVDAWPGLDWVEFIPDGYVRFDLWVGIDGKEAKAAMGVALDPGVVLPVRVQGAGGTIAGADVYVLQRLECGPNQKRYRTAANGLATVSGLAPGVPFELSIHAEDHTVFEETWTRSIGASETSVRLQPVGFLMGRVLGPEGLPVAGVRVAPHRGRGKSGPARWRWTECDEAGRFRLPLDAGAHRIVFSAPSGSGLRAETRDVDVRSGVTSTLDLRLKSR